MAMMDDTTCTTTVFPGLILFIAALLLEQYLGSSDKIKANSIAGLLMNVSKAVFAAEEAPSIGEGPHPVPPEKAPVQVLLS